MARTALITGITGQDGSYLAEHLLGEGYEVHGLVRRAAIEDPQSNFAHIANILGRLTLHPANLESYPTIFQLFGNVKFDECYHLAARSFVGESFGDGFLTLSLNINGTYHMLSALRELQPNCRFYFAGSSEMFGRAESVPQNETTPFHPRSPYGISKVAGFELTRYCRETYGMFCVTGLLFNHESPRRGHEFASRKISLGAARIKLGLATELRLGNLNARRDWGHAADYVRAMHMIMMQPEPDDYVIATGVTHSIADFCEIAFNEVGLDYREYVIEDERFYRPAEAAPLVGDASKAKQILGWEPTHTFDSLVREMVRSDLEILSGSHPDPSLAKVKTTA